MMMTKKQLKAIRRRKDFERKRNIRNNRPKAKPFLTLLFNPKSGSHTYRLYNI